MTSPRGPRWRAWLFGISGGLAALLLAGLFAVRQPPIATRLASTVLARLPAPRGAVMSVREMRGDWLTGFEARGFRMARGDTLLIAADTLRVRYRLASLFARRIDVQEIELAGAIVTADIAAAGLDSADSALAPDPEDPSKPPLWPAGLLRGSFYGWRPFHVERLIIRDGRYDARAGASDSTLRLTGIALRAHDVSLGDGFSFVVDSLEVRGSPAWNGGPAADVALAATLDDGRFELRALALRGAASAIEARGVVALDDRDSLSEASLILRTHSLALGDLHTLAPGLALEGVVATELDLHGTRLDRLSGTVALSFERARIGSLDLGPSQLDATLDEGRAQVELSVLHNGSRADVSGWIEPLGNPPTYDLEARIDRLAIRIPGMSAREIERAEAAVVLRVRGSGYAKGAFDVEGRADSDAGHLELEGRLDLAREFEWVVRRLAFENVDVARLTGDTTASALSGTLTATGRGADPRSLRALAELEIGPSTYGEWRIEGARVRARLDGAQFGGALGFATNAGALDVDSIAGRWDSGGTLRLLGARFRDVDLARFTRNASVASRLRGTLSGEVRGFARLGSHGGAGAALRDGRVSAQLTLELAPSQFRGQEIDRGAAHLSLADGLVSVTGDIASASGRADFDAGARPFDSPQSFALREARFADLDLAPWTGVAALRSKLSGTLTGGSRGEESDEGAGWVAALHLDSSRVGGVEFDGGEARASSSGGRTQLAAHLLTAGDSVSVQGEISVRDGVPEGTADVSIPFGAIAALAGRDSLASEGRLVAATSFVGLSPATATMRGEVTARGSIDSLRVDSLRIDVRLEHGVIALDTLAAFSNVGHATGSGRVALFDSSGAAVSDLHASFVLTDASPLGPLLGADTLGVRGGSLALQLGGPAGERVLEARGALGSLAWDEARLLGAEVVVRGAFDREWRVTSATADASVRRLDARGFEVSDAGAHVAFAERETEFDASAILDDHLRLRVGGRALSDSLGTHVTLETADAETDSIAFALVRPARFDLSQDRFAVDDLEIRSADSRIAAHGVIDRRGDQDFRLEIEDLGTSVLSAVLGREGLGGTVNGDLTLEGSASAPRGNGSVHVDLESNDRPAGVLRSNLMWDGTHLDVDGSFSTPAGDSIAWHGHLPMAVSLAKSDSGAAAASSMRLREGDVDVRLTANRFPLGALSPLLDPRAVGEMEGTLDLDARLQGSRDLVGNGTVALTGGVVPLPALGVTYREIEFSGQLEANDLVIRRAHMESGKGSLDVTGEIQFVSAARAEPRLHVSAKRFTLADSRDLRAIASAELDVTGTVTGPVVKGTARIENSSYNLTPSGAAAAGLDTTLHLSDADVQMMEDTFGFVDAPGPGIAQAIFDASDLDLDITLERDNWLRQRAHPRLAVAFGGNVHLRKAPFGEPELLGRIELVPARGYVEQFARSFDIVSGEVLLNGKMETHTIDIEAQYKPPTASESGESDVIVRLDIEGSTAKMDLTLSSEPPMSDSEIVNYIATGQSRAAGAAPTGSSDQDANIAKDIGVSQMTSGAEQAAQEAIGLDVLQIRFDALQGATLVAGRYLNSQLYVGFRQPLQYKDTASPSSQDEYNTSFDVEYAIHQWLILNLQGETSTLRSFIRARHAY